MPPPRIAHFAREPSLNYHPPAKKDVGGYGVGATGFGLGSWGLQTGSTGTPVTPFSGLGVSAAWGCVNRVAQDHGKLTRRVMRRLARGVRQELKHPLNSLLRAPNPWQNATQFWGYVISWYCLRGNSYVIVTRNDGGDPDMLIPVAPDRVQPVLSPAGELYYMVSHQAFRRGESFPLHRDNVMHIRTLISMDGYTGVSPLAAGPDVFGLGIAAQQFAAVSFRQGARLAGVLTHPARLKPEAKSFLREEWQNVHAGTQNAFKTAVLDEGMKFEPTSMNNDDAQLLETRQFSVVEICRMFGVPPHKIYGASDMKEANIEQQNLAYWADTLFPIGKQIQEECSRTLLFEDEQDTLFIDTDWDELNKTDRATRYATDEVGIRSGRLSLNEARVSDGREPNVPGGDNFQIPLNMGTASAAGSAGRAGSAGSATPVPGAAPKPADEPEKEP